MKIPIKFFLEAVKKFKGLPYRSKIIFNSKKKIIINNKLNKELLLLAKNKGFTDRKLSKLKKI